MKISYIIPMYNTNIDKFKRCILSIIDASKNMNIEEYEIIVINDGSNKENTKEYQLFLRNINNIVYIKNENHGVCYSRNIGIEKSTKDYIMFVDSDDYLITDNNYFDNLIFNSDIILFDMYISTKKKIQNYNFDQGKVNWKNALKSHMINSTFTNPVAKLYKREFLNSNNIRFNENFVQGEDYLFNLNVLVKKPTIYYYSFPIYNYEYYSSNTLNRWKRDFDKVNNNLKMIYERKKEILDTIDFSNNALILKEINNSYIASSFKNYLTVLQINNKELTKKFSDTIKTSGIKIKELKLKNKIYYTYIKINNNINNSILRFIIKIKKIIMEDII